jgi:hypothetical protein
LNESDFKVALSLAKHLLSNSAKHMAEMPGVNNDIIKHRKLEFMIEMLPDTFTRKEANEIGEGLGISLATLTRYLSSDAFERTGHGRYRKKDAQSTGDEPMSI